METKNVINFSIAAMPCHEQLNTMIRWAKSNLSKVVCIANVHMLVEGHQNPYMETVLRTADMVTPDGMPLVWMLRFLGAVNQDRVAGLDVLEGLCKLAIQDDVSVYFLGSQSFILAKMRARLEQEFPQLKIAGMSPLPFRPLTDAEDEALIKSVNRSGAGLVFVSLGCPKQELWMAQHKGQIAAVMVGLGGAFPVYAGIQKRASSFIRHAGLEWFYRLIQEPQRLWKRYATTIPIFLWLAAKQICAELRHANHLHDLAEIQQRHE
jgi:N-acetylglucosaminyldiphosphoundecaprenol N-acetyl-beta-D-mannosaminyltransferase